MNDTKSNMKIFDTVLGDVLGELYVLSGRGLVSRMTAAARLINSTQLAQLTSRNEPAQLTRGSRASILFSALIVSIVFADHLVTTCI